MSAYRCVVLLAAVGLLGLLPGHLTAQQAPGTITTFAGTGTRGFSGEGVAATQAQLNNPTGVGVDGSGNVYIADANNNRVRRVGTDGKITTIAGTGTGGFSGEGVAATQAQLNNPYGVGVDGSGNVYIADFDNHRIRRVGTDGKITTFAGTGTLGFSGEGVAATQAQLNGPQGVAVDGGGNVYIADYGNHRIRRVGTDGKITTFAGTGTAGFSGEGVAATQAQLNNPYGVGVDGSGNVYIADLGNYRIRRVAAQQAPAISLSATSLAFDSTTVGATSQKTFTISNTGTAALSVGSITSSNPAFTVSPTQFTVTAPVGTVTSSQTVAVTFAPTSAGPQTGTLTIPHNAAGSPATVALTGVGRQAAAPAITLSATALAFDSTTVGATSQKTLTIKNTGTASLSVTGIKVTGTDSSQFSASPATATVAAGDSAKVTVTFAPTSAGAKSASLSIAHNAAGSPTTVALTGVGKQAAATQPPPASNTWTAVNTGLTNTSVGDLAIDPKTPQTVYAGTLGGVFKTTNGGTAWNAANTGLTNLGVEALAIDPSNPQTLYAGTGGGIFKTTNGGTSWTAVNSGLTSLSVNVLEIDPSSPQTVYAGAGSTVSKSTNGGSSWTAASTGLPGLTFTVFALAVDPKTPQTLYVSVRFRGVFKSTDGGTSWTAVSTGIPEGTQVYGLSVDPSTPQTVYAGSASGVFKSTNGGTSWTAVNAGLTNTSVVTLEMDPSNPQTVYAGPDGSGVFRSTDGAATWSAVNAGLPDPTTVNAFAIDPSNSQTVYAGTQTGGVYKFSYSGPPTQPPPTTTVPEPAKQDSTKLGVWLDLNTAAGNQYQASGSAGPSTEVTVQVFGRNMTSATSFGFTLAYDPAVLTFVGDKSKAGDYLPGGIALSPLVSTSGGVTQVTFGAALLGGSPVSGNGFLGVAVFKVSDKFTDGYTEIKVKELKLGGKTQTIQTSNAILKALKNAPPVAKFTIRPDAIKAGDAKGLVTLDASASSDPDGDPITFKWSVPGATFKKATSDSSQVAKVVFADAKSNIDVMLTVTDKNGAKTTVTQTLKVLSPPLATASVAVDLDPAADNQNTNLKYSVKPGDLITLQVFVKDVTGVTGYTVKVSYDSAKVGSPAYANGPLVTGTFIPLTQNVGGVVQGGGSTLPPTPSSGSGLLATFTFKVRDGFADATILSVTSVSLQAGSTKKELVTASIDAEITADKTGTAGPASNFTGSGTVGFDDFFLFAGQFNTKVGDANWDPKFDLNGDGVVGFDDFFIFAAEFGITSSKPAVEK